MAVAISVFVVTLALTVLHHRVLLVPIVRDAVAEQFLERGPGRGA